MSVSIEMMSGTTFVSPVNVKMSMPVALERTARHPLDGLCSPERSPTQLPRGVMSLSLGQADKHRIEIKLLACVAQGWTGVEIHMDDVKATARRIAQGETIAADFTSSSVIPITHSHATQAKEPTRCSMLQAASSIASLCRAHNLRVICLEPLLHYPGLLPISRRDALLRDEIPLWLEISDLLDTDLIQVASAMFGPYAGPHAHLSPASCDGGVTSNESRIVTDLRLLATIGAQWPNRPKFFAYEAMSFGYSVQRWQDAWRQVCLVDLENFGMVLDTMQMIAACVVVEDPYSSSINGSLVEGHEAKLQRDLQQLRETFVGPHNKENRRKLFLCQLGDAQLPSASTVSNYNPAQHANSKMAWARTHRQFAAAGNLPGVQEVANVIFNEIGYKGWVSAEYFNTDTDSDDALFPFQAAKRCQVGHEILLTKAETMNQKRVQKEAKVTSVFEQQARI